MPFLNSVGTWFIYLDATIWTANLSPHVDTELSNFW